MKLYSLNRNLMISAILIGATSISACSKEPPQERYGYEYSKEARMKAKSRFFDRLAKEDMITENDNWQEKLEVRKSHFHNILNREYNAFAQDLNKKRDYTDASFFRRKAVSAKRADFDLMPENPVEWDIKDENELEALRKAREDLIESLVGYTPIIAPTQSAKAIVSYDCWMKQAQRSITVPGKNCHAEFNGNYSYIKTVSDNIRGKTLIQANKQYQFVDPKDPVYHVEKAKTGGSKKVADSKAVTTTEKKVTTTTTVKTDPQAKTNEISTTTKTTEIKTTVVPVNPVGPNQAEKKTLIADRSAQNANLVYMAYFDMQGDVLTDKAKAELDKAYDSISKNSPQLITINGHTDRSLDTTQSLALSKKRADAARNYLISKGINGNLIRTYGFGKTDNISENKEGTANIANNRAEIIFEASVPGPVQQSN